MPDWWPSEQPYAIGDTLEVLRKLPDNVIHTVVTSPPYWALRDYGIAGQLGQEPTPEEYVLDMVRYFAEVKRVLHPDGTLWLNLGDCYNGSGGAGGDYAKGGNKEGQPKYKGRNVANLKAKDLVGIPWAVAFGLRDIGGWYLRSDIIWSKPNPYPESVLDRPAKSHEYIFLLTKESRYFYDVEAIREPYKMNRWGGKYKTNEDVKVKPGEKRAGGQGALNRMNYDCYPNSGRNKRSVWDIQVKKGFSGSHFATFPPELPEICIKAGTSEKGACPKCGLPWERILEREKNPNREEREDNPNQGGLMRCPSGDCMDRRKTVGWKPSCNCDAGNPVPCVVLDPFAGSGTTIMVARQLGRVGLGIELNPEYGKIIAERIGVF